MGDGTLLRGLRRQVAESCEGLFRVPVNHHLLGTAEEEVEVAAALLARIGNIGGKLRCQVDGGMLDDRLALRVKNGEAQASSGDGGETDDAAVAYGGKPAPTPPVLEGREVTSSSSMGTHLPSTSAPPSPSVEGMLGRAKFPIIMPML